MTESIQLSLSIGYSATIDDKKDAVRTLADVLEFLRKEGIRLPDKDDDVLFQNNKLF